MGRASLTSKRPPSGPIRLFQRRGGRSLGVLCNRLKKTFPVPPYFFFFFFLPQHAQNLDSVNERAPAQRPDRWGLSYDPLSK
jgi:hypothetical protein